MPEGVCVLVLRVNVDRVCQRVFVFWCCVLTLIVFPCLPEGVCVLVLRVNVDRVCQRVFVFWCCVLTLIVFARGCLCFAAAC